MTASDYATYLGVSKQAITAKMKMVKRSFFSWEVKALPNEQLVFLKEMIKEEVSKAETTTHFYQISYNPKRNVFAFIVFPKDISDFPMCWRDESLPSEITQEFLEKDFHVFNNNDFIKLQNIRTSSSKEYSVKSGSLYNPFRALVQKHYEYYNENGNLTDFYLNEEQHGNKYEKLLTQRIGIGIDS